MFRIYPYKLASQSARRLKEALGGRPLLKPDGQYRPNAEDIVINWGSSTVPNWLNDTVRILNKPAKVALAANKLKTFRALQAAGVPTIPFTTDWNEASDWDSKVYVRTLLESHSGEGIVIVEEDMALPQAPLYTAAIVNNGEYRVHVMNGDIIDYRKKSRTADDEPTEAQSAIRTLENGWIFRQGNLRRLERIENLAIDAIDALGLDFGAVDIILNQDGQAFVLEVNTAVGLADNTLESYISNFETEYGRR